MTAKGQPSSTAIYMALARALADREPGLAGFSDPVAIRLLPAWYVARLDQIAHHPRSLRSRLLKFMSQGLASVPLRTVAIDEALKRRPLPAQFAILGAGLDTRAWRLRELFQCTVFEIDLPLTQQYKRDRVASIPLAVREIRFVPIDFERESLTAILDTAGHDPAIPTTWLWEGVIPYLSQNSIRATLKTIAERSARGSRLLAQYSTPNTLRTLLGILPWLMGEPFRSLFSQEQMDELLSQFGFSVVSDESAADWAKKYTGDNRRVSRFLASERLAISERK